MQDEKIPEKLKVANIKYKRFMQDALEVGVMPYLQEIGFDGVFPNFYRGKSNTYQYVTFDFIEKADLRFRILLGVSTKDDLPNAWKTWSNSFLADKGEIEHSFIVRENQFAKLLYESQPNLTKFPQLGIKEKCQKISEVVFFKIQNRLEKIFAELESR